MKCLVTGAAGFIGFHLIRRLLDDGHEVYGVDNFITGQQSNIDDLVHDRFTFVEHDCSESLPKGIAPELIFHFASPASPPKYQKYPVETLMVNSIGTKHVLDLALSHGATVVYASSSEIYGDPEVHPQKEDYWGHVNPVGPRSCYDEAKRFGEAIVATYISAHQTDARMVRIFNTYGPRMDLYDGRVVTNFIEQALSQKPLTIYGDGSQTRSFCYVSDLVDGIVSVGTHSKAKQNIYNVGNPTEMTIKELAEVVQTFFPEAAISYKDLPQDDPTRRKPDISKIQRDLAWIPKISLNDGLSETIAYFKARHQ